MPSKQGSNRNLEAEEALQAVVVADSFNNRFQPLTQELPRCLLPLVNVPLIEYTLEFLAVGGIQEIYVLTCAYGDKIKQYLKTSKWNKSGIKITTVDTPGLRSMGDALREVDRKGLVKSDFVLISGDVVSNMNLEKAITVHKTRRSTDKNAIMTMVVKSASDHHRTRARGEEALFVIDAKTHECVHYETSEVYPKKTRTELELEWFQKHPDLQVRNDFIDCQVDICSLDVPALFQENFDYQHIRTDFVRGVLESDVLTSTIHCYVLEDDQYASRVRSTHTYDSVSKDIITRWTYPMVPDNNISDDTLYYMSRRHVYLENPVFLARSSVLTSRVILGSSTSVDSDTTISESTIGRDCKIGAGVTIDGSYIWESCEVKSKCKLQECILGKNVVIHENTVISIGCILGSGVQVGPNIVLPPFSKLSTRRYSEDSTGVDTKNSEKYADTAELAPVYDRKVVGAKGRGYLWPSIPFENDLEDLDSRNYLFTEIGRSAEYAGAIQSLNDTDEEGDDEEDDDDDSQGNAGSDDEFSWKEEAGKTLRQVLVPGHTVEDVATELNTTKFAHNVTFNDIRASLVPFVIGQIDLSNHSASAKEVMQSWGAKLLSKYAKSEDDQLDCLQVLHDICADQAESPYKKVFPTMLRLFYENDIADEDAIMKWYGSTARATGALAQVRELAAPLIKFLQEADEESEEESGEEDDESD
ncbi:hypothetical protein SeMB42_g05085 [Synchytrium endobioticum]|uniref:Translation initiation factor eIF2B subunit epsilon n=1 Tax=Synchytrium endobioticum TaxID=286115 RepID=A0A507CTR2_9FUNG|nr:hypothetical protein SeMB42_g05085 [Synchytrium endobioticum]TPX43861.1 hypothetical protein SeLEV6574_g04833 [Synchytrium endobioticum]